jgi:hypothetical protein
MKPIGENARGPKPLKARIVLKNRDLAQGPSTFGAIDPLLRFDVPASDAPRIGRDER